MGDQAIQNAAFKIAQTVDDVCARAKGPRFMFQEFIDEVAGIIKAALDSQQKPAPEDLCRCYYRYDQHLHLGPEKKCPPTHDSGGRCDYTFQPAARQKPTLDPPAQKGWAGGELGNIDFAARRKKEAAPVEEISPQEYAAWLKKHPWPAPETQEPETWNGYQLSRQPYWSSAEAEKAAFLAGERSGNRKLEELTNIVKNLRSRCRDTHGVEVYVAVLAKIAALSEKK